MRLMGCTILSAVAIAMTSTTAVAQVDAEVLRESAGARRDALTRMELKPLDPAVWNSLDEWTNGDPVTAADTQGKVVVFYTWSSFLSNSLRPMSALSRLASQHADDLIVIGVHHQSGWDEAAQAAERRRASFPIAHDRNGKFRELLDVDQDPDLYIVDRAGQLRYADVTTSSLQTAVDKLLAETSDAAAGTENRLAAEARDRAAQARRTRIHRQQLELSDLPEVAFDQPSESAYADAKWPTMWTADTRESRGDRERDETRKIELPSGANWHPQPPSHLDGRARMIYFMPLEQGWGSGDVSALYDLFESIQRSHKRDLVVVGGFKEFRDRNQGGRDADDEAKRLERLGEDYKDFVRRRPLNHATAPFFGDDALYNQVIGPKSGRGGQTRLLPYLALVSSDGMLRWHGTTQRFEEFRAALDSVLANDPGIAARRAAEDKLITSSVRQNLGVPSSPRAATNDHDASPGAPDKKPDSDGKKVSPADYRNARWPAHNTGELYGKNVQGRRLPASLGSEQWITSKPAGGLDGRVLVLDFWATWCGPCKRASPKLDGFQRRHGNDLAVLAIGGQGEDLDTVRSYANGHSVSYHHLFDASQRVYNSLAIQAIPHTVIMSTDGVVRWQGNPLSPEFDDALNMVLQNDPVVKSRN